MKSKLIRIEYSLDSLGDISPELFEKTCRKIATRRSLDVEFVVGLSNRESQDDEPCDLIVERAFNECCDCDL